MHQIQHWVLNPPNCVLVDYLALFLVVVLVRYRCSITPLLQRRCDRVGHEMVNVRRCS